MVKLRNKSARFYIKKWLCREEKINKRLRTGEMNWYLIGLGDAVYDISTDDWVIINRFRKRYTGEA